MQLTHRIALCPTPEQADYFKRACGTSRKVWNWALGDLKRLATVTALPVASPTGNGGAAPGMVPDAAGKVTPVRYECGQQDTSGQEKNCAHIRALS